MVICCGMAMKRVGMLGVSVGKMKALTVNMEIVTLTDKGRQNLTCCVYSVCEINSRTFVLTRHFIFGGNAEKTKSMVMSQNQNAGQNHNIKTDSKSFERVEEFKYLGTTLTN
jgi:hypothetical protein